MLTKRQLEDAIKCRDFGTGCCDKNKKRCSAGGVGMCIENAAQTAIAYRVMLERLEWSLKGKLRKTSPEREYYCPICENNKRIGHASDCELAALLKESEGEEG